MIAAAIMTVFGAIGIWAISEFKAHPENYGGEKWEEYQRKGGSNE